MGQNRSMSRHAGGQPSYSRLILGCGSMGVSSRKSLQLEYSSGESPSTARISCATFRTGRPPPPLLRRRALRSTTSTVMRDAGRNGHPSSSVIGTKGSSFDSTNPSSSCLSRASVPSWIWSNPETVHVLGGSWELFSSGFFLEALCSVFASFKIRFQGSSRAQSAYSRNHHLR